MSTSSTTITFRWIHPDVTWPTYLDRDVSVLLLDISGRPRIFLRYCGHLCGPDLADIWLSFEHFRWGSEHVMESLNYNLETFLGILLNSKPKKQPKQYNWNNPRLWYSREIPQKSPRKIGVFRFSKENIWTAASDGDVARVDALMALEGFTPSSQAPLGSLQGVWSSNRWLFMWWYLKDLKDNSIIP